MYNGSILNASCTYEFRIIEEQFLIDGNDSVLCLYILR